MKNIKLLSLLAALSLVSCAKEMAFDNENPSDGNEPVITDYITLVTPVDLTKVAHDSEGNVTWTEGDKIRIYFDGGSAESYGAVLIEDGAKASFTVPLETTLSDDTQIYAVYPSTTTATLDGSTFNVTIPSEQSARYRNADILAATTTVSAASLGFHHVAGLVSFTISDGNPKGIDSGVFKDFFKSAGIAGVCPLTFDADGTMTIGTATDTESEITLTDIQEGENYIAILPGVTMESVGLKLKSGDMNFTPMASDTDLTVEDAHVKPLNIIADENVGDAYYIKESATGKGTSWEDAAGVSLISDLMSTPFPKAGDIYQRRAAAWRLDGQEIRIAEGEYELPGTMNTNTGTAFTFQATDFLSKTTFTIDGGYESDGIKSTTVKAAFTGNSQHPIMALWRNVNATINNVIFKNGSNDGDDDTNEVSGIAGAVDLDNGAVVTFNHCEFTGNKNTKFNGGAVSITDNAGTNGIFNSCSFSGNESSFNGGAVNIGNSSATFENCTFSSNKTTANGGGAIFFNNDKLNNTLTINNSTFDTNTATYGGAALLLSNGKKATVKGTTFTNNTATTRNGGYHGAVAIADSDNSSNHDARISADFEDCAFLNNTGGGVAVTSCWPTYNADSYNGEYISFDGCRFEENTSDYRGGALWVAGTLPVFMNACSFRGNCMTGTQTAGSTISMVAIVKNTYGMLAMNNCTVSDGKFESTGGKTVSGDVYLRGKSIVANSTILGDGTVAPLSYITNNEWGDIGGSVVVNSIICGKKNPALDGDTYYPSIYVKYEKSMSVNIAGYYNLYQEKGGGYIQKYTSNQDSAITKAYADFNFTESNYGTDGNPNYLFDYTIPTDATVTKIPTVAEVETAIKSQTTERKTGYAFGTMFYDWLTKIGAAGKDARGHSRATSNRQGALVK